MRQSQVNLSECKRKNYQKDATEIGNVNSALSLCTVLIWKAHCFGPHLKLGCFTVARHQKQFSYSYCHLRVPHCYFKPNSIRNRKSTTRGAIFCEGMVCNYIDKKCHYETQWDLRFSNVYCAAFIPYKIDWSGSCDKID